MEIGLRNNLGENTTFSVFEISKILNIYMYFFKTEDREKRDKISTFRRALRNVVAVFCFCFLP